MLELGKLQKLTVVKTEDFGVYLAESLSAGEKERVLLPKKQVPEGTKKGDPLEVFEDPKEERTKQFLRVFER